MNKQQRVRTLLRSRLAVIAIPLILVAIICVLAYCLPKIGYRQADHDNGDHYQSHNSAE